MRQGSHLKRSRSRPHQGQRDGNGQALAMAEGRSSGNPRKHVSMRHQNFVSNGPEGTRISGNAFTILEKYLNLARDASTGGDRIAAENFYQHAEHYFRLINANNEGQYTPQTPREHFEADGQGGAAQPSESQEGEEASPPRATHRRGRDMPPPGEAMAENDAGGEDETETAAPVSPSAGFGDEQPYAGQAYGGGDYNNGGAYGNTPNQARGRGRFRDRRTNPLYQTGTARGGRGGGAPNGDAPQVYDPSKSEQPHISDYAMPYEALRSTPQPSFDLSEQAPHSAPVPRMPRNAPSNDTRGEIRDADSVSERVLNRNKPE